MSKWLKFALFTLFLIGAGYFFGQVCKQIEIAYALILQPSKELLTLLLNFLLTLIALLVAAGLVAALLRPLSIVCLAFVLSGLAILLGWKISILSGVLVLIYALAGIIYTMGVDREMKDRIRFSVRCVSTGQAVLSMSIILVACGSLYSGYKEHIDQAGFSLPEPYIEFFLDQMEKQIELPETEEGGDQVVTDLREQLKQNLEDMIYERLMPYEAFIPLGLSAGVFMSLLTLASLLMWLPILILRNIFSLLTSVGVISVVSEMREVQWLVID